MDAVYSYSETVQGQELEGREILVCWDDGVWYDAVVVCYYPREDEYKLVYRADDGIEIAKLRDRRWILAPKKKSRHSRPVLDGAVVEFKYPSDGNHYKAMVYDYSHWGERLKIAYIDEHTTDNLKGGGWEFLTASPCLDTGKDTIVNVAKEGDGQDRGIKGDRRLSIIKTIGTKRRTGKARRRGGVSKTVRGD